MLTRLKTLETNPRILVDGAGDKLMMSIIRLPEMMAIRPIVYNPLTLEVLSGNQKFGCLKLIFSEGIDLINIYTKGVKSAKRKQELRTLWAGYLSKIPEYWFEPAEQIADNKELQDEFVIRQNVHFGRWDKDMLKSLNAPLEDWGVPSWEVQDHTFAEPMTDAVVDEKNNAFRRMMTCPFCGTEFELKPTDDGAIL